ncbi:hypothetical protein BDN72DRAFT_865299 [Pluteus cervinus]|uniref:Uncharacterized protein n=1 Tax=Pluteus cervinus TaxID=181527 RepID=A0ACD3A0X3_9AGAR|nr:hypothetical protein BDN72DRAFT_865299 [Pluteus cervinus]
MPKRCFDKDQLAMLQTKVGGFLDAQSRGRGKAYARAVHSEFSKRWPEREELFPGRRKIKPEEEAKIQLLREKKEGQILSWLHRSSAPRGRLTGRAIQHLVRKHRNKRKRAYQPGEVYNQLYPAKVNAVYEEQKTPDLSRGQRLNLIRKIANELLEGESEEVKEEVKEAREKKRNELHAEQDVDSDLEAAAENADSTLQEYIEDLPIIWSSLMDEVGKLCPDWGFQLVAAGPMPKADNKFHVFDIYTGPKSIEGYTLSETLEGFSSLFCAPLCHKDAREQLLAKLKYTIAPNSEDSDADDQSTNSRRSIPTPPHDEDSDGVVSPPRRKTRQSPPLFTDSEIDEAPPPLRRAPPLLAMSTSDDDEDEVTPPPKVTPSRATASKKSKKHTLETFPLACGEDSDSEGANEFDKLNHQHKGARPSGEPDQEDVEPKSPSPKKRKRQVTFANESDEEPPSNSSALHATKRAATTAKRLETRRKNAAEKEAATKAQEEEEARLKREEEARLKKIAADEARANRAEIEKLKTVDIKKGATKSKKDEKEKLSKSASPQLTESNDVPDGENEAVVPSSVKSTADDVARKTNTKSSKTPPATRSRGSKAKSKSDNAPSSAPGGSQSTTNGDAPPRRRDASPAPSPSLSKAKEKNAATRKRARVEATTKDTETAVAELPAKRARRAPAARDAEVSFAPPPRVKRA